jgi:hypothetical protein
MIGRPKIFIVLHWMMLSVISGGAGDGLSLEFDSATFQQAWVGAQDRARVIEYIPAGEATDTWSRMISLQCHPYASELKEVTGPYYAARKGLVAMQPEVVENEQGNRQDSSLVLFLGGPGVTEHVEFVIARFITQDSGGVYAIVYSHRFPASKNVDVSAAVENKDRWIQLLAEASLESIVSSCRAAVDESE